VFTQSLYSFHIYDPFLINTKQCLKQELVVRIISTLLSFHHHQIQEILTYINTQALNQGILLLYSLQFSHHMTFQPLVQALTDLQILKPCSETTNLITITSGTQLILNRLKINSSLILKKFLHLTEDSKSFIKAIQLRNIVNLS
jgi:hypothetical protein